MTRLSKMKYSRCSPKRGGRNYLHVKDITNVMDNISELFSVPLVAVYGRVKNPEITSIIYDDEQGGYEAYKRADRKRTQKTWAYQGNRGQLSIPLKDAKDS